MPKTLPVLLFLLLLAPASTFNLFAAVPETELRDLLASKSWAQATSLCEGLPKAEGRRPDIKQLKGPHYAQIAALCAAAFSGAGDQDGADWWWFTAAARDSPSATKL